MDDATVPDGQLAVDLHHAERIVQERKAAAEAEPQRLYVRHAWAAATRDAIARLALSSDAPRGLARAEALLAPVGVRATGSQILPLVIGEDARTMAMAAALQRLGFDVRGIRPPTVPAGTSRWSVQSGLSARR